MSDGKTTSELAVHIRWMIRQDMPEVLDIECLSFKYPWLQEDFFRCLQGRNSIGIVAEHKETEAVVGFMIYELHKTRLHILKFVVHPGFRRRQVGTQLINTLIGKLSNQRRTRILLEVRERNLSAQFFFRSMGFRAISVLRNFYKDTSEDAYLMEYRYRPTVSETLVEWEERQGQNPADRTAATLPRTDT